MFYSIMADYSQSYTRIEDASHGDDFLKYGHVGKFDVFQTNSYEYDQATGRYVHNGWKDTLVTFEASEFNPELAAINNQYFSCSTTTLEGRTSSGSRRIFRWI